MAYVTVIAQEVAAASTSERKRLQLQAAERVVRVRRVRHQGGRPRSYEILVLPLGRFAGLATDRDVASDISELARDHGLALGMATERVRTVKAGRDVAAHLGVAADTPLIELDRVTSTLDGLPAEWRVAFIPHP